MTGAWLESKAAVSSHKTPLNHENRSTVTRFDRTSRLFLH